MDYKVIWEIDVTADSPRQAAEQARAFQAPGTSATVFTAVDEYGTPHQIDLMESEDA